MELIPQTDATGSLTGSFGEEHLAKPSENDRARSVDDVRRGFLQAQKSEAQTYTSTLSNQACKAGVMRIAMAAIL
jgi:hypothetical protein